MPANDTTVARLMASVESLVPVIDDLRTNIRTEQASKTQLMVQLQEVQTTLRLLKEDMVELTELVRIGNSQPSMLTRLTKVEILNAGIDNEVNTLKSRYDALASAKMLTKGQIVVGALGMLITIGLALGAMVVQIISSH